MAASVAPRLGLLNPRVDIASLPDLATGKDAEFFKSFDMILMFKGNLDDLLLVDSICHASQIKFWAASNMGFYSFVFSDLGRHDFTCEVKEMVNGKEKVTIEKRWRGSADLERCKVVI
jgi:ubiquitin-like 1-activating enzyme E1 A